MGVWEGKIAFRMKGGITHRLVISSTEHIQGTETAMRPRDGAGWSIVRLISRGLGLRCVGVGVGVELGLGWGWTYI